jgi:hypothetical protein
MSEPETAGIGVKADMAFSGAYFSSGQANRVMFPNWSKITRPLVAGFEIGSRPIRIRT